MAGSIEYDSVVEAVVEAGGPGAAVAVLEDGVVVHRNAYGLADLEWSIPLSPDCSFRIASLTKQFTAAAILRLQESGRLSIDDPIEAWLPDWSPRGRRVTIRHLLNHTSGIRGHDEGQGPRTSRPNLARMQVLESIRMAPFDAEPGHRYRYNNSGYLLLGEVIEAASGEVYERFLKSAFFDPLGMSGTRLWDPDDIIAMRARGYVRGRRRWHNARPDPLNWSHSAGALCSTLDDLAIWDRALRDARVIAPATFGEMIAPTMLAGGESFPYGFGWGIARYGGRDLHHHTGGISGYACQMARLTHERLTVIVLSNLYLFPFDRVTRGLLRVAMARSEPKLVSEPIDAAEIGRCVGAFINRDGDRVVVGSSGLDPSGLVRLGEGRFCAPQDPEVEFRFTDLGCGAYQKFEWVSPLWPIARYDRVEG
jgi:CubicO group peptidase (beta-lactamase class C family)